MQGTSTGWIAVDLGAVYQVSEVRLNWETAYAVDYQIQVSTDDVHWTSIVQVWNNQRKGVTDFSGLSGIGCYVRIYCTQVSAGSDNFSLYDLEVYGSTAPPAAISSATTPASVAAVPATATTAALAAGPAQTVPIPPRTNSISLPVPPQFTARGRFTASQASQVRGHRPHGGPPSHPGSHVLLRRRMPHPLV
jgi:hypothetical protein